MTTKEEIKFWEKAKSILIKGYGKTPTPHKGGISLSCAECKASIAVDVIRDHIDLLKWNLAQEKETKE